MMISIVIPLSRCCLPNDEGPGPLPQIFFLEPPLRMTMKMPCTSIITVVLLVK